MRNLIVIFGDQLNRSSAAFDDFDKSQDAIWMAEVEQEASHVWCHKLRIAFFFSAMRHFRDILKEDGFRVHYHEIHEHQSEDAGPDFFSILRQDAGHLEPQHLVVVEPGDYRVRAGLQRCAEGLQVALEVRQDRHFLCSTKEFAEYAQGKSLVLEYFYRYMRKKHKVLIDAMGEPVGGAWNYDKQNREPLKVEPPETIRPGVFPPDAVSQAVIRVVEKRFWNHPGSLSNFNLPVTAEDASKMLEEFVRHRLALFGSFQDAMRIGQPFLYHSRLSALLNVKLLDPRDCIAAAVKAYQSKLAPLNSVEGFVRQILGWREFVRGIYWLKMPEYQELNFFEHKEPLPHFYWDGETDMRCIHEAMQSVLANGYAHHIQRLMVLGLFAQLYGADPRLFHEWHMAMYLDAIDWVSLPNALGMSQYGDGGIIGTKPYCATGNYINKMSNYCRNCRYDPKIAVGKDACPFTSLYYAFLDRHFDKLVNNPRLKFQLASVTQKRRDASTMQQIHKRVSDLEFEWQRRRSNGD